MDAMAERDPRDDDRVTEEESAAGADAGRIGGRAGDEDDWPAEMRPVYEAGGGEQEGFETAQDDLIDNASHGDGHGDPLSDAFSPEAESDRSGAAYGEGDQEKVTEVVDDPQTPDDDPGAGPKLTSER